MANGQKTVLAMLVAILLLEFGSLTKLQTIWDMAQGKEHATPDKISTPWSQLPNSAPAPGTIQISTPTHPGTVISV